MSNQAPKVFCIQSLKNEISNQSIDSYLRFRPSDWPDPILIEENESRAASLLKIFNQDNAHKDLFIFVDDIIFIEKLEHNNFYDNEFGILGMQMLKPSSEILHNAGFKFIHLDGLLTYVPIKEINVNVVKCDVITGCLMFIKYEAYNTFSEISEFGFNRWEELIYSIELKRIGILTGIVPQKVIHFGTSTKNNPEQDLSSISWLIERQLWEKASDAHLFDLSDVEDIYTEISPDLRDLLSDNRKKIIYGAGVNTQAILNQFKDLDAEIISGLIEEENLFIGNRKVCSPEMINFDNKVIIITPIGYDDEIKEFLKNHIVSNELVFIKQIYKDDRKILHL